MSRQTTYKKLPCDLTEDEIRTYSNEECKEAWAALIDTDPKALED